MTKAVLNTGDLRRIVIHAADEFRREEANLNALDAAVGDGDHGITMRLGFEAVKENLERGDDAATISSILEKSGEAFMSAAGGAIGVILAKMLLSGGAALRGVADFGTPELKTMLVAMERAVSAGGKVKPGDKTILDAIHAAQEAVDPHQTLAEALSMAEEAAAHGAQRTADMICRVGRGSRLGERTRGHCDPGAVSFSIILRAFSRCPI
jgi:dihydroxyacetone kinase-like protein